MKIAIDISQAQFPGTGVGNYTRLLAENLVSVSSDHQIIFFGGAIRNRSLLKETFSDIECQKVFLPLSPKLMVAVFNHAKIFPIEMFVGGVDVFHSSDWAQPRSLSAQLVTTIHDVTTLKFPEHHHPQTVAVHKRRLDLIKSYGVHIIADSEATKKDVIDLLKIPPERIDVVHLAPGADYSLFSTKSRQDRTLAVQKVKQKYQLENGYVLSVGTNEPRKNLDRTIKAFKKISHQFPNLNLAIAGKFGWGESKIQNSKSKIQNLKILGFVDQEDLPALYAGADIFVYPSLYEGFGLPVLEAMTVGTPVVTSKRGSLSEVAGQAAEVVNPLSVNDIAEGMITALNNRSELRAKGKKHAATFSWEKTAESTLAVYEKLLP